MNNKIYKTVQFAFITIIYVVFSGCAKMEEKKSENINQPEFQQGQPTPPAVNDSSLESKSKEAFDFNRIYKNNKSEKNRKELIEKHLEAGNSLLPEENLQIMSSKKFRKALKHYKKVLELDSANLKALEGIQIIEEMYRKIGKPLPEN